MSWHVTRYIKRRSFELVKEQLEQDKIFIQIQKYYQNETKFYEVYSRTQGR